MNKREIPRSVERAPLDNFYYKEVAKLTEAGSWSINFKEKKSYIDSEARRILNTPPNFVPKPKTALEFYAEDDREKAQQLFFDCSMGKSFTATLKMLTFNKKEFWVKASGEPLYDSDNNIIGVHGVFQDINSEKLKELSLENSLKVIESQNSRLFNFAHIVSHNLRSHSSNLQLTLELLNSIDSEKEEKELKTSLHNISQSLNETILHLNEIVAIQSHAKDEKKMIQFDEVLYNVKSAISRSISDENVEIFSDFSEVPEIEYIPAYMESIFLNLITNAIKYRHSDRNPMIDIFTYYENGYPHLMFKDNGVGIDLEKYGNRLFNMYQTFHENSEAVGIGLFMTKNQVDALGGSITAESKVSQGTIFRIKLK